MGIFSKLKQAFGSNEDQDRYLSGLDKSRSEERRVGKEC